MNVTGRMNIKETHDLHLDIFSMSLCSSKATRKYKMAFSLIYGISILGLIDVDANKY